MSQSHHAVRQKRQDPSPDPEVKDRSAHPKEEVTEDLGASRNKKSTPVVTSSLFQSDPEENVRLWMEKFFPGIVLSREEAIRQWLARPPEFRVQSFPEVSASNEGSSHPDTPVEVPRIVASEVLSSERGAEDVNHQSAEVEQTLPIISIGVDSLQADRSRKLPRLFFRLAAFSVLAFVIIKLLWAIPMTHVFPRADASIPTSKSHNAASAAAPTAPVSKSGVENAQQSVVAPQSVTATQPSRIESVSIGCKDTQPCVVISMLGKENVPTLSALTNPDRLVIDFQDSAYSSDIHRIPVGRGAVKVVRIGRVAESAIPNTRVVIDLVAKCEYELDTLTNKFIVNIYPKDTNPNRNKQNELK